MLFSALIALSLFGSIAKGQEVYSQIVGAIAIDLPAESDVIVAFPFKQSAEFRGVIDSTLDNGQLHLVVATDSLTNAAFDAVSGNATHYVVIESGAQEGNHIDISANTASQITLAGGSLAGLAANDEIAVYPHWTLSSAFPLGVANNEETEPGLRKIEVIIPEATSEEGNMIPQGIFYFYNGGWREVGEGLNSSADGIVLNPGRAFVIRNNDADEMTALVYGEVIDSPIAIPLSESDTYASDNFIGLNRPLAIALNDLGLTTGGVFTVTTDAGDPQDMLLVYSQTATGKNKQPVASYYYFNGAWRELSAGSGVDKGGDLIQPGMGLAIRKVMVGSNPQDSNWVNEWDLPQ